MARRIRSKELTLAQQDFLLRNQVSGFTRVLQVSNRVMVWKGSLQSNPLFKRHDVEIEYDLTKPRPNVFVESLDFSKRRPPHLFPDDSLCLYHRHGKGAWDGRQSIVTLIPMISHWLWCYEMWLVTSRWYGEEFPHLAGRGMEK